MSPVDRQGGEAERLAYAENSVVRCTCKPPASTHYYARGGPCVLVVNYWPRWRDV